MTEPTGEYPRLRRTATVMLTDMVGYSALTERDPGLALQILEEHRQLTRPAIALHGGREVKTIGDAFLVEFPSGQAATLCAIALQLAHERRNAVAAPGQRLQIRIGIHDGEVVDKDGDIYGDGVNIAARIEPLAPSGGIVVSEPIARQLVHTDGIELLRLGAARLKNISAPMPIYLVGLPGSVRSAALRRRTRFFVKQQRTKLTVALSGSLIVAVIVGAWLTRPPDPFGAARRVMSMTDVANGTRDSELDGLRGMFVTALEHSRKVQVLTQSRMYDILRELGETDQVDRIDEPTGIRICEKARIPLLGLTSVQKLGDSYTLDFKLLDIASQRYILAETESALGKSDIPSAIERLATRAGKSDLQLAVDRQLARVASLVWSGDAARRSGGAQGLTTRNLNASRSFDRAEKLAAKLDWEGAVEAYSRTIDEDPQFALAHLRLTEARLWREDPPTEIEATASKAVELSAQLPEHYQALARAHFARAKGFAARAVAEYEGLVARSRAHPDERSEDVFFWLGDVYVHSLGEDEKAAASFEESLRLNPAHVPTLEHLTALNLLLGRTREGVETARQWVKVKPVDDAYELLALGLAEAGRSNEALASLERWAAANRSLREPLVRAQVLVLSDELGKAADAVAGLSSADSPAIQRRDALGIAADVMLRQGQIRRRRERLDAAVALDPESGDAKELCAEAAFGDALSGKAKSAISALDKCKSTSSWVWAVATYLELGDFEAAAAENQSEGHDGMLDKVIEGRRLQHQGHCDKAEPLFREAAGGRALARLHATYALAECRLARGDSREAEELLLPLQNSRAFAVSHPSAVLWARSNLLLAETYEKRGNAQKAKERYLALLERWRQADDDRPELARATAGLARLDGRK